MTIAQLIEKLQRYPYPEIHTVEISSHEGFKEVEFVDWDEHYSMVVIS